MSNIMILVARELELERIRAPFAESIMVEARRRTALRQFYRLAAPQIIEAGPREWGIDPYEVDWISVFTPIELALWHDIRAADLVMYPQYPIAGYFVDFANPAAKVCVAGGKIRTVKPAARWRYRWQWRIALSKATTMIPRSRLLSMV